MTPMMPPIFLQVAPYDRTYPTFIEQGLLRARHLTPDQSITPIMVCDTYKFHSFAKLLLLDKAGQFWFTIDYSHPSILAALGSEQMSYQLYSFQGSLIWLNLRWCDGFNTFQLDQNPQLKIDYGIFYYHLSSNLHLIIIYPLQFTCQTLSSPSY